jgi:AcrR family transcriptional regulator
LKKPSESQRKSPQQGRSKALVDSIFEATTRILPKVGSKKITTKKIAEVAGVSIGSLYQYFTNKESVLGALMDMGMSRMTSQMNKNLDQYSGGPTSELINSSIDYTLKLFLEDRAKNREIFRYVSELDRVPALFSYRQKVVERIAIELEKNHPGFKREEYVLCSFIGCNSIMGIVLTMLYDENQKYSVEELSNELKLMLNGYLEKKLLSKENSATEAFGADQK